MTGRRITKDVLALYPSTFCLYECTHRKGVHCPKTNGDPCPHDGECLHEFKLMKFTHWTKEGIKEFYGCSLCGKEKVNADGLCERAKWRERNARKTAINPNWRTKAVRKGLV